MKNAFTISLIVLAVCGGACLVLFVWQLHPWISPGAALPLGRWQVGDYQFQAWQRKNQSAFEPFADGLFVRRGTNEWQAFCFDIQDNYSPKVELRKAATKVHVFRDGEHRGVFDMEDGSFRCGSNTAAFSPNGIGGASEPPGRWRLK